AARAVPAVRSRRQGDQAGQPLGRERVGRRKARLIRSMTGFGAAALERDGLSVRVELRSVNHRHLQVKSRLPSELAHLEPELEGRLRKRLWRGLVSVHVYLPHLDPAAELEIDERAAERYAHLARDLAKRLGMAQELSVKDLLGLPGVL